jgi:nucleoside-diphosphate-sugar epimerase
MGRANDGDSANIMRALRWGIAPLPGSPLGYISSVSHDDAACAVIAALTAPAGIYNVVDDEPVTRETYVRALASLIHAPRPHLLPRWMKVFLGVVSDPMSRSLRLTNARLKRETGWTPRYPSIHVGLPATVATMRPGRARSAAR